MKHLDDFTVSGESLAAASPASSLGEPPPATSGSQRFEFERVAHIHADRLLRFAMKLCSDQSRAEDLVQDTLLSAWCNFHQFQLGTNCRAWLFKILVNLRNKQSCRRNPASKSISTDQPNIAFRVPENISGVTEVRVAFESLSEEHRDILHLSVVEGFSVRELAGLLAIPPGTVMSRLSRARARLRAALGDRELVQDTP